MDILRSAFTSAEDALEAFGLMTDDNGVAKRLILGAVLAMLVTAMIKPRTFFDENGKPYPWKILKSQDDDDDENGTLMPWWTTGIIGAILLGVMI